MKEATLEELLLFINQEIQEEMQYHEGNDGGGRDLLAYERYRSLLLVRAFIERHSDPSRALVPREATQKMALAAKCVDGRLSVWKASDVYRAMIKEATGG